MQLSCAQTVQTTCQHRRVWMGIYHWRCDATRDKGSLCRFVFKWIKGLGDQTESQSVTIKDLLTKRGRMEWNSPAFIEAIRLARKFFPECKPFVSEKQGLGWEGFVSGMKLADWHADFSCNPYYKENKFRLLLASQGGFDGGSVEIYHRLVNCTGLSPDGRAVIVPEALGTSGWSKEEVLPFLCHSRSVATRLASDFFDSSRDILIIYESGAALAIHHDLGSSGQPLDEPRSFDRVTCWACTAVFFSVLTCSEPLLGASRPKPNSSSAL